MTVKLEHYITALAAECFRSIRGRNALRHLAAGRHDNYVVVVARDDSADALEAALREAGRDEKPAADAAQPKDDDA